ncbi:hypothetical protein Tco_0883249 [Tanacetum coccineum]
MRQSIECGPLVQKKVQNPKDRLKEIDEPVTDLSIEDKERYYAYIKVMNFILQCIPNDMYNFVDACQDAQAMWNHVKRLMQGIDLSEQERHLRLMDEFDKFFAEAGESLTSVYKRFSTLINYMDQNVRVLEMHQPILSRRSEVLMLHMLLYSLGTLYHSLFISLRKNDILIDGIGAFVGRRGALLVDAMPPTDVVIFATTCSVVWKNAIVVKPNILPLCINFGISSLVVDISVLVDRPMLGMATLPATDKGSSKHDSSSYVSAVTITLHNSIGVTKYCQNNFLLEAVNYSDSIDRVFGMHST